MGKKQSTGRKAENQRRVTLRAARLTRLASPRHQRVTPFCPHGRLPSSLQDTANLKAPNRDKGPQDPRGQQALGGLATVSGIGRASVNLPTIASHVFRVSLKIPS